MKNNSGRLIAIVGASGAGKTTLCRLLSGRIGAWPIPEDVSQNPLANNPADSLGLELEFLRLRKSWLANARSRTAEGGIAVIDTLPWMSRVYAGIFCDKTELAVFEKEYARLDDKGETCDVIIHLFGPAELLAERAMARQGKTGLELRQSKAAIIARCAGEISAYLESFPDCRTIHVDAGKVDLRREEELEKLIRNME